MLLSRMSLSSLTDFLQSLNLAAIQLFRSQCVHVEMRSILADRNPLGLLSTELISYVYAPHLLRQNGFGETRMSNVDFVPDVNVDSATIE